MMTLTTGRNTRSGGRFNDSMSNTYHKKINSVFMKAAQ